jgi:hypothetical protein
LDEVVTTLFVALAEPTLPEKAFYPSIDDLKPTRIIFKMIVWHKRLRSGIP